MAKFDPTKPYNKPAPQADVRRWVASKVRTIQCPVKARSRIKQATKAVDLCMRTPGCDPQHHLALAHNLRHNFGLGA